MMLTIPIQTGAVAIRTQTTKNMRHKIISRITDSHLYEVVKVELLADKTEEKLDYGNDRTSRKLPDNDFTSG